MLGSTPSSMRAPRPRPSSWARASTNGARRFWPERRKKS
jgi:hypothetical protein